MPTCAGDVAERLLDTFPESMRDAQYYLWTGNYDAALRLEPDNERALLGKARRLFADSQYDEAYGIYDRLTLMHPDRVNYQLNKAVCQVNQETALPTELRARGGRQHPARACLDTDVRRQAGAGRPTV